MLFGVEEVKGSESEVGTMMEVAHAPLSRTHTAPIHTRTLNNGPSTTMLQSDAHAAQFPGFSHASPASGATLFGTNESISSSAPSTTTNGGTVMPSDSIINQVADSSRSLYQICVKLRQRLSEVPGFERHLEEMEEDDNADDAVDPVSSMWRCLRKGYPLMTVYNALRPEIPLEVDESKVPEPKRAKTASFKFVQACLKDLQFPSDECFLIMDLYGDDTTGFVKVSSPITSIGLSCHFFADEGHGPKLMRNV